MKGLSWVEIFQDPVIKPSSSYCMMSMNAKKILTYIRPIAELEPAVASTGLRSSVVSFWEVLILRVGQECHA